MAPDGILPLCLSQLYDVAPSASHVKELSINPFVKGIDELNG